MKGNHTMYSIIRFGLLYGLALVIGFYASHLAIGTSPDNFTLGRNCWLHSNVHKFVSRHHGDKRL